MDSTIKASSNTKKFRRDEWLKVTNPNIRCTATFDAQQYSMYINIRYTTVFDVLENYISNITLCTTPLDV